MLLIVLLVSFSVSSLILAAILLSNNYLAQQRQQDKLQEETIEVSTIIAAVDSYFLDEFGTVATTGPDGYVPTIDVVVPSLIEGEQLKDPSILATISLIKSFNTSELALEHVKIYNDHYIELTLSDQARIICSAECDSFLVVSTLQNIYSAYKIEGRMLDSVDFRFSKPIVVERYGT